MVIDDATPVVLIKEQGAHWASPGSEPSLCLCPCPFVTGSPSFAEPAQAEIHRPTTLGSDWPIVVRPDGHDWVV